MVAEITVWKIRSIRLKEILGRNKMQLKTEDNNEEQKIEEQKIDDGTSNNTYFDPNYEFDVEAGGLFGTTPVFDSGRSDNPGMENMNDQFQRESGDNFGGQSGSYGFQEPPVSDRPRKLSKKEFFNSPRNRKDRDRIILSSVVVIILAIFDIIRVDFWLSTFKNQIDMVNDLSEMFDLGEQYYIDTHKIMMTQVVFSVILISLGIGIFIWKSRVCAIAGIAITGINMIMTLVSTHQFRWYWTVIAFGYAVVATISYEKAWRDYEANGDWKRAW